MSLYLIKVVDKDQKYQLLYPGGHVEADSLAEGVDIFSRWWEKEHGQKPVVDSVETIATYVVHR